VDAYITDRSVIWSLRTIAAFFIAQIRD